MLRTRRRALVSLLSKPEVLVQGYSELEQSCQILLVASSLLQSRVTKLHSKCARSRSSLREAEPHSWPGKQTNVCVSQIRKRGHRAQLTTAKDGHVSDQSRFCQPRCLQCPWSPKKKTCRDTVNSRDRRNKSQASEEREACFRISCFMDPRSARLRKIRDLSSVKPCGSEFPFYFFSVFGKQLHRWVIVRSSRVGEELHPSHWLVDLGHLQ